jgi:tetratricopeptide (TPR) repeat protein
MSKPTQSSLFMFSPFKSEPAGFYQELLRGVLSYPQLGNRLIHLAERAHIFRQFDKVKEYGQLLANLPLKPYQDIGYYFLGVAANSRGNGDQDEAKRLFELVVSTAPDAYKVKAILSLGSISIRKKDFATAIDCFQDTTKVGGLTVASLQAIKAISILKAMEGSHRQAVNDLEHILPLIKYAPTHIYFDILNSYAVELGEVGRKDEARNIMRVVLASPYARVYPEWRETAEELRLSRRSMVALRLPHGNVLALPEREASGQPLTQPAPAQVFNFAKLRKKILRKMKKQDEEKSVYRMSTKDMGFKLLELITDQRASEAQMRTLLLFALKLFYGYDEPSPPDDDKPAS